MTKKKNIRYSIITFIVVYVVVSLIAAACVYNIIDTRRQKAAFLASSFADRIEAEFDAREYIARIFEITIKGYGGDISEDEFIRTAEALFNDYLDIVNISLAPDGIVSEVYPDDTGLSVGSNLFEEDNYGVYSDYSKLAKLAVIVLKRGENHFLDEMVIRRPIFLDDDSFWGFVSITFDLESFLADASINDLSSQEYEYKLVCNNTITGESEVIEASSLRFRGDSVEKLISTVGGDVWSLSIFQRGGWFRIGEYIAVGIFALLISLLIALLVHSYLMLRVTAKELEVLSYRDALTDLNNPRSYQEHMTNLSNKKLPYGLIFMDLNDFKKVNDTYGHDTGDALLNIVAKRLKNSIREKDMAFRIGGDEFVVVIHGTHDKKFYEGVIARMRQNVAREVVIGDVELNVSISAGYARCPEDGTKFEDVVKKADDAMYYNKRLLKDEIKRKRK